MVQKDLFVVWQGNFVAVLLDGVADIHGQHNMCECTLQVCQGRGEREGGFKTSIMGSLIHFGNHNYYYPFQVCTCYNPKTCTPQDAFEKAWKVSIVQD